MSYFSNGFAANKSRGAPRDLFWDFGHGHERVDDEDKYGSGDEFLEILWNYLKRAISTALIDVRRA